MFETLEINRMAHSLAKHAGARMGVIAQNIANADTPGYLAKDLPDFAIFYQDHGNDLRHNRVGHMLGSQFDPGTALIRQDESSPNGNSVSLETEMVKSAEARQQHDMALSVYNASSSLLRVALGRK